MATSVYTLRKAFEYRLRCFESAVYRVVNHSCATTDDYLEAYELYGACRILSLQIAADGGGRDARETVGRMKIRLDELRDVYGFKIMLRADRRG